jgi:UDP-N-acetylmuramoyl-tripeptide--D-alanyl-D-alanine ligase
MNSIKITLEDLFNIPGAVIYNPDNYKSVSAVTIDSRNIPPNALFIAIKGKKFDGHAFIKEVVKKGACAVVINKNNINKIGSISVPVISVPNTTLALGDIARIWRNKLNAKVIGITGSAGKTSTKEILAQLLGEKYKVNKTISNNNNHIGVPLTILSTNNKHNFLIVELGTNHFGEIQYTAGIAQPDFALITNIADSHLEFFHNMKGVLQEKSALTKITDARKGLSFINNDDKLLNKYGADLKNRVTYGFNNSAKVKGKIKGYNSEGQAELEISSGKKRFTLFISLYGEQNAKNFLAAAAVALKSGLSEKDIKSAATKLKAVDKRLNVNKYNNLMVIDDTYNANPESMKSSLELLGRISKYNNRTAVLGDMFELGKDEIDLHKKLYPVIKRNKIDSVFTIGNRMKHLNGLLKNTKLEVKHFNSRNALSSFLGKRDYNNSVVLVKGSRGMKMEEFVHIIEGSVK